jgi:RNA polymerase sigma factor (sigma-70 family)
MPSGDRAAERERQGQWLRAKESNFARLAREHKREEFFQQITPLLGPLKSYIKRRLRVAYLDQRIRSQVYTSSDILDETVLRAYENYQLKPNDLTLEQWLYRLANEVLDQYIRRQEFRDAHRRSLEELATTELRSLEEPERMTADAEGEVMLVEDLDDSEYQQSDLIPPATEEDPEQLMERKEQIMQILRALSRVQERDRIIFELYAVEGFSKEEVAKIVHVTSDEVPRITQCVRQEVFRELLRENNGVASGEHRTKETRKAS